MPGNKKIMPAVTKGDKKRVKVVSDKPLFGETNKGRFLALVKKTEIFKKIKNGANSYLDIGIVELIRKANTTKERDDAFWAGLEQDVHKIMKKETDSETVELTDENKEYVELCANVLGEYLAYLDYQYFTT